MDGITLDQFNAAFGDLNRYCEQQSGILAKIEGVLSEKLTKATDSISLIKKDLETLVKLNSASLQTQAESQDNLSQSLDALTREQQRQSRVNQQLNKTIFQSFRALSSSFLTKDGMQAVDKKRPAIDDRGINLEPIATNEKKQLKASVDTNTKIGALLKEIQEQRKDNESKNKGGLMGFLAPLLTLVGGFAVLSYAAMKFGPTRRLLEGIQKNGIAATLKGMIGKFAGKQKDITTWLRGLPLIGRFFDIYDAFTSFAKGDWKTGLKYLAFAVPFGEDIIQILGGTTKQQFLEEGGGKKFIQGFNLNDIWTRLKTSFTDAFNNLFTPIVDKYHHIQEVFGYLQGGTLDSMTKGWVALGDYFPALKPVAKFISDIIQHGVFESDIGKDVASKMATEGKPVVFGDIVKDALGKVYEGISKFFHTTLNVFMKAGDILNAIGDLFSGDYSKQSAALNKIEDYAPGVAGTLRAAMNFMARFEAAGITADTDPIVAYTKLKWKGGASTHKFDADVTTKKELLDKQEQLKTMPAGEEKEKVKRDILVRQSQVNTGDLTDLLKQKQAVVVDKLNHVEWAEDRHKKLAIGLMSAEDMEGEKRFIAGAHSDYEDAVQEVENIKKQIEKSKERITTLRAKGTNEFYTDTSDTLGKKVEQRDNSSLFDQTDANTTALKNYFAKGMSEAAKQYSITPTPNTLTPGGLVPTPVQSDQLDVMANKLDLLVKLMDKNNQLTADSADDITEHLKNMPLTPSVNNFNSINNGGVMPPYVPPGLLGKAPTRVGF